MMKNQGWLVMMGVDTGGGMEVWNKESYDAIWKSMHARYRLELLWMERSKVSKLSTDEMIIEHATKFTGRVDSKTSTIKSKS